MEKKQALVICQKEGHRKLICEYLSSLGIETTVAAFVTTAIAYLENREFDLIFVDGSLPTLGNSLQLVEDIRANRATVPIILMTGGELDTPPAGSKILRKPTDLDTFTTLVREFIPEEA